MHLAGDNNGGSFGHTLIEIVLILPSSQLWAEW
jgi:hypothetical protein